MHSHTSFKTLVSSISFVFLNWDLHLITAVVSPGPDAIPAIPTPPK